MCDDSFNISADLKDLFVRCIEDDAFANFCETGDKQRK